MKWMNVIEGNLLSEIFCDTVTFLILQEQVIRNFNLSLR